MFREVPARLRLVFGTFNVVRSWIGTSIGSAVSCAHPGWEEPDMNFRGLVPDTVQPFVAETNHTKQLAHRCYVPAWQRKNRDNISQRSTSIQYQFDDGPLSTEKPRPSMTRKEARNRVFGLKRGMRDAVRNHAWRPRSGACIPYRLCG